ncbi:GNAT family N-acetyltransferase [Streptomyces sp. H39-S7]|uniref:GNAT family N-acetyltransferase n=1 Tax=Streptomyces sp. H39-S7 TaxID=3004357 RepID=UPI0022AE8531|nr:GNAT family N-acetyltransferase [Streptomyces sp. H39-S7]MCZ4125931.1 GNAT family N-acetyltransferase [Streptomyces sp. H39-S7]
MERPRQLIECGDFVLRRWRGQDDFAAAFTLIEESVDHLRPWELWATRHSETSTRGFLTRSASQWASGDVYNYAITQVDTLIGMCQSYRGAEPRGRRIGYWLHPAATGQGIATGATAAMVTEMFTLPEVDYLEITHDLANISSAAIPRRLGFTEVRHQQAMPPAAPAGVGIDVIWRLNRPAVITDAVRAGRPAPVVEDLRLRPGPR